MRVYSSFLIRYWLAGETSANERSVLQAEHIQTGTSMRAASLMELEPWFLETCRRALTENENSTPSEEGENQQESSHCEGDIQSAR
jgi:hypothetical protein